MESSEKKSELESDLEPAHHHLNPKSVWLFFGHNLMRFSIVPVALAVYFLLLVPPTNSLPLYLYQVLLVSIVMNVAFWVIGSFLWSWLTYHSFKYRLGPNCLYKEVGIISKRYIIIPFENIQNIEIVRSFFAQIFGLSELRIETAGQHTLGDGRLPGVAEPLAEELKEHLIKRARETKANILTNNLA